jgi:hypothetical protein
MHSLSVAMDLPPADRDSAGDRVGAGHPGWGGSRAATDLRTMFAGRWATTVTDHLHPDHQPERVADLAIATPFLSIYSVRNLVETNLKVFCNHCYLFLDLFNQNNTLQVC